MNSPMIHATNEQPNDTHNKITNSDINDRDNQCC